MWSLETARTAWFCFLCSVGLDEWDSEVAMTSFYSPSACINESLFPMIDRSRYLRIVIRLRGSLLSLHESHARPTVFWICTRGDPNVRFAPEGFKDARPSFWAATYLQQNMLPNLVRAQDESAGSMPTIESVWKRWQGLSLGNREWPDRA